MRKLGSQLIVWNGDTTPSRGMVSEKDGQCLARLGLHVLRLPTGDVSSLVESDRRHLGLC